MQFYLWFVDSSLISELKKLRISVGDFNLKGIIGRGHFGEVQVVAEKQTGDVYAMKVLRKLDTLSQQNVRASLFYLVWKFVVVGRLRFYSQKQNLKSLLNRCFWTCWCGISFSCV